jgi:DNA-binding winged helix-turn-helix (wHTH) protein
MLKNFAACRRPAQKRCLPTMSSYHFFQFELIPATRRLLRDGVEIPAGARVFEVMAYLIEHRRRAVGRDELLAAVWGRADLGDATLAQAILKVRRTFGDDGNAQNYVRTVARFGYQWVAPVEEDEGEPSVERAAATPTPEPVETATIVPAIHAVAAPGPARRRTPRRIAALFAASLLAAIAVVTAFAHLHWHGRASPELSHAVSDGRVPGLVLVMPTDVHSIAAEDGWMRLGVMSLGARSLGLVPGHAVVPDETTLAVVAHLGATVAAEPLRVATGASIIVSSKAERVGDEWHLDATVLNADGSAELVSARAADAVSAASLLARNLRDVLAPEGNGEHPPSASGDVLALAAHMKAAILEAQTGRALALLDHAPALAKVPEIVLLQAEALTQLGKSQDAAEVLQPMIDAAIATGAPPRWLPDAWTALGDSELARGHPGEADTDFRHAIQLEAIADRRSLGLAWRGLGIAQLLRNDLDGGEQSYLRARLELEPVGDRLLLARITDGLGFIATARGRMADALDLYEQAAAMGAAVGLNETELGSQLNAAQANAYLLHHSRSLEQLRGLLPRIRALDYPALHRFGSIEYINALIETGAWSEARRELARLADASNEQSATADAGVDVRLDEAQIDVVLGDYTRAIALADAVRHERAVADAPDLHLEGAATLLDAYVHQGDGVRAAALTRETTAWESGSARAPARLHAQVALAAYAASTGDAADAIDRYHQALRLAREFGAPLLLRDAALPFARFQLAAGAVEAARATAALVGPYAADDFDIALLTARVAAASHNASLARSYYAEAHRLAGERWLTPLAAEAEGLAAGAAGDSAGQVLAGR